MDKKYLPLSFSVDDNFDNDKFLKLRLKICHTAKSLNNTIFRKEALEDAGDTIANVPILAHIYENDEGNLDIGAHDIEIERDRFNEAKLREIFIEQPVGVVPETNNYEVVDEDGISYAYCDGYIWKGYSNYCVDILQNSDRIKLSMEVDFLNYHYSRAEDCYVISKYKYLGITLLGSNSNPAMQNSGAVITNYSESNVLAPTVEEMCNEISKVFSVTENIEKGEDTMDIETKNAILSELGVTEEELDFEITEDMTEDELRSKVQEYLDNKPKEDSAKCKKKKKCYSAENRTVTFAICDEDKRELIYKALDDTFDDEYWIMQTYDDYIIAESWMDGKYYKIGYTNSDGIVTIDSDYTEVFGEFLTAEEKAELDKIRNDYAVLESENEELKQYKENNELEIRNAAVNAVFAKFDEKLGDCEEYVSLKENNSNYSADEIEEKCFAILGRLNTTFAENGSATNGTNRITFSQHNNDTNAERKPYGGLFEVFSKN